MAVEVRAMGAAAPRGRVEGPNRTRVLPAVLGTCALAAVLALAAGPARAQAPGSQPLQGTITVDDAVRRALSYNLDLLTTQETIRSASGRRNQALQGYTPSLSISGSLYHDFDAGEKLIGIDPNTGQLRAADSDAYSYGLRLSQNLLDFGAFKTIQAANRNLDATKLNYEQARADLVLSTKQQYYGLLAAQLLAEVADSALVVSQQELKRVQSLFDLGMVARGDVLKAQVRVSQSQLDVITSRNNVVLARARLARILGQDPRDDLRADRQIDVSPVEVDSTGVFNEAMVNRADLQAAQQGVQAANAALNAAQASRYPTLSGSLAYSKAQEPQFSIDGQRTRSGTVQLNVPIFQNPLGTRGSIQQSKANAEQAKYALAKMKLDVEVEIREAVSTARQANEGLLVAQDQLEAAKEDLKLSQEKYNVGSGTILELIDAQVALQRARTNLVQAVTAARLAEAQLERVRGRRP